jgi:hypothetical protein
VGAAFQPRIVLALAVQIAAGLAKSGCKQKPLPHLKIKRPLGSIVLGMAREEVHLKLYLRPNLRSEANCDILINIELIGV